MRANRDAAAIIRDSHAVIRMKGDADFGAEPGPQFVY